jgi:hypothetical protein
VASFARAREEICAKVLIGAAKNTTVTVNGRSFSIVGADGKNLFATDHPAKVEGDAQTNKFSNEFSTDALSEIETRMQNFKDDRGNNLNIAPDTIAIPNDGALKKAVFAAIGADKEPETANNGYNYQFGRWTIVVSPYLNGLIHIDGGVTYKPYILLDSNANDIYAGGVFVRRAPLKIHSWLDENTGNNVWNGRERYGVGINDWRPYAVGGCVGGTDITA